MNKEKLKQFIKSKRWEKYWETAFKESAINAEKALLDYICEHIEFKEEQLNDLYVQAYQLQYELNNIDIINIEINEGMEIVKNLKAKFKPLEDEYYKNAGKVTQNYFITALRIKSLGEKVLKNSAFHLTSETDKFMLMKKSINLNKKLAIIATSFDYEDVMESDDVFRYTRIDIEKTTSILNKRKADKNEDIEKELEQIKKERQKYLKIFDYKDMISFAKENNCEQVRQTGGHLIFANKNTGIPFPIPSHKLGKGLQDKIKKQIINAKQAAV